MNCLQGRKWYTIGASLLVLWLLSADASAAGAVKLKTLYNRGYKAFQARQWKLAAGAFYELLPLLKVAQGKRTKGTKRYHMMTVGRCDVLYHLATLEDHQKNPRISCRLHQRLGRLLRTIPPHWRTWRVHPELPLRFDKSGRALQGRCAAVPALVSLRASPPNARISILGTNQQWSPIKARRFPTRKKMLTLRLQAPGYETLIVRKVKVPQWGDIALTYTLKKKPKPRVVARIVPRRRPALPPAPVGVPFYRTWWFWTLTGAVVIGAVTIGVIYAVRDRELLFQDPNANKHGFPVW